MRASRSLDILSSRRPLGRAGVGPVPRRVGNTSTVRNAPTFDYADETNGKRKGRKGLKSKTKRLIGVCALIGVTVVALITLLATAIRGDGASPRVAKAATLRSTMANHILPFFGIKTKLQNRMDELFEWSMFQTWYREYIYSVDSKGLDQALQRSHAERPSVYPDTRKIAFIFLLGDGHTQGAVWDDFFADAEESKYNVYAHRSNATQNSTFLQHLSTYNEISTTASDWCALMGIEFGGLQAALRDPTNEQFVFISHNTIPIKNFDFIYNDLIGNSHNTSKFCFTSILGVAKSDCRFQDSRRGESSDVLKHHQWIILSRRHAEIVLKEKGRDALERYNELREIKEGIYSDPKMCSDETVPSLALIEYAKDLGMLERWQTEQDATAVFDALEKLGVEQRCTTFVYWDQCLTNTAFDLGRNYTDLRGLRRDFAHPLPLEDINPSFLQSLVDSPSLLFARKFKKNATVRHNNVQDPELEDEGISTPNYLRFNVEKPVEYVRPPASLLSESGVLQQMWMERAPFSKEAVEMLSLPRLNLIQNYSGLITSSSMGDLRAIWKNTSRDQVQVWDEELGNLVRKEIENDVEGKTWGALYRNNALE